MRSFWIILLPQLWISNASAWDAHLLQNQKNAVSKESDSIYAMEVNNAIKEERLSRSLLEVPSFSPTTLTATPTIPLSASPTTTPSPTQIPTVTLPPTQPSFNPTRSPTLNPTTHPTMTHAPTLPPSSVPTYLPTVVPTPPPTPTCVEYLVIMDGLDGWNGNVLQLPQNISDDIVSKPHTELFEGTRGNETVCLVPGAEVRPYCCGNSRNVTSQTGIVWTVYRSVNGVFLQPVLTGNADADCKQKWGSYFVPQVTLPPTVAPTPPPTLPPSIAPTQKPTPLPTAPSPVPTLLPTQSQLPTSIPTYSLLPTPAPSPVPTANCLAYQVSMYSSTGNGWTNVDLYVPMNVSNQYAGQRKVSLDNGTFGTADICLDPLAVVSPYCCGDDTSFPFYTWDIRKLKNDGSTTDTVSFGPCDMGCNKVADSFVVPSASPAPTARPSLIPSPLPTMKPTEGPSLVPTLVPTSFTCETDASGNYDPSEFLTLAYPLISSVNSTVFPVSERTSLGSIFNQSFGGLFNQIPGKTVSFKATIGSNEVTISSQNGGKATTALNPAVEVLAILKTPTVYLDETALEVAFQLKDLLGRTNVLATNIVVLLEVKATVGSMEYIENTTCTSFDSESGIGTCSYDVSTDWFSESFSSTVLSRVKVYYESTIGGREDLFASDDMYTVVEQVPVYQTLTSAGMYATFPYHPLYPGDEFDVTINAATNGQSLNIWVLSFFFNDTVIAYQSTTTSDLYASAVITDLSDSGKVTMSTSGLQSGVTDGQVTGSNVSVVTLTFKVRTLAGNGGVAYPNLFRFKIDQMVNQNSIAFASDIFGQINDNRAGTYTKASIIVFDKTLAGIFAYTKKNEILNTFVFDGEVIRSPVESVGVYNLAGEDNKILTGDANISCSMYVPGDDRAINITSTCDAFISSPQYSGGASISARVSYSGSLHTNITYRVWYPDQVFLNVSDVNLGLILPGRGYGVPGVPYSESVANVMDLYNQRVNCLKYQRAQLYAYARFSYDAGTGSSDVMYDVSNIVGFKSSNESMVYVEDNFAYGLSQGNGSVMISFDTPTDSTLLNNMVEVKISQNDYVYVDKLNVVVISSAEFVSDIGDVDYYAEVTPKLQLYQDLSVEGATAYVATYAEFDDGTMEDVSSEVTLSSSSSSIVVSGQKIYVATGAESLCGPLLTANWELCDDGIAGNGTVLASAQGVVALNMAAGEGLVITTDASQLTLASDGAAAVPFSIGTSITFSVAIAFSDGSSQDVTDDPRLSYSVATDGSQDMIELNDNVISALSPLVSGTANVFVSFVGTDYVLNTTFSVTVVEFSSITISTAPYPVVSGWSSGDVSSLQQVACSGVYQRLYATATGTLSDGTIVSDSSFYNEATFASTDTNIATVTTSGSLIYLTPITSGTMSISAEFYSVSSSFEVSIADTTNTITSISINSISDDTLSGVADSTQDLVIDVSFDDFTEIALSNSGETSSSWLSPSSLLSFSSSLPSSVSVSTEGSLTLIDNWYEMITLTVSDQCSAGLSETYDVYANLFPAYLDVDFGSSSGVQFQSAVVGSTFTMDVRIEGSDTYDITAFQISVYFNSTVMKVASDDACAQGSDWSSTWSCTTNDPIDEVLVIGSCGLSPSTGCGTTGLITVASITFDIYQEGISEISGFVTKIKDDNTTVSNVAVVAGDGPIEIAASRRRLQPYSLSNSGKQPLYSIQNHIDMKAKLDAKKSMSPKRRTLLQDCTGVYGDTNGDCIFDVEDVQFLQYYIGGSVTSDGLTAWQRDQLDPDLDGDSDGVDISFLVRVLANKYRFMANFIQQTTPFYLSSYVLDRDSAVASTSTTVSFEIGTSLNQNDGFTFISGNNFNITQDGIFIECVFDGTEYEVEANAVPYAETDIGVVVMIETSDSYGDSSDDRKFAFYCTRLYESCVSVYGDSSAAFLPYTTVDIGQITLSPVVPPTPLPTLIPFAQPSQQPTGLPTLDPTRSPSQLPTMKPSRKPSPTPTPEPSFAPTPVPTHPPTPLPTLPPSSLPTLKPTPAPTALPTLKPSPLPTLKPTPAPTALPTLKPTPLPTLKPTPAPTALPTLIPSPLPTLKPSPIPTPSPTPVPSPHPTPFPTLLPSMIPNPQPSPQPTPVPNSVPTLVPIPAPTPLPTLIPSPAPSGLPTLEPSPLPTLKPSPVPSGLPTLKPSPAPTMVPIPSPTQVPVPAPTISLLPTFTPTPRPSQKPTPLPTLKPSPAPSGLPTLVPSPLPTLKPTPAPTALPTLKPTPLPTLKPTPAPTALPTLIPSPLPTLKPTPAPTALPTLIPSPLPTLKPTPAPTALPTLKPSPLPTLKPTPAPTGSPSFPPSPLPTVVPSIVPTMTHAPTTGTPRPTLRPSPAPTYPPSFSPTPVPSLKPTGRPSPIPTPTPTHDPTQEPTIRPTQVPTAPSAQPTSPPSHVPIPLPTAVPVPSPTSSPVVPPTSLPSPQPSNLPTPQPTMLPTASNPPTTGTNPPSMRPTVRPSLHPSPFPTFVPTPKPTELPSLPPTSSPSWPPSPLPTSRPSIEPTHTPTQLPTTADTTSVDVSFRLTASAAPTETDKSNLKTTTASEIGLAVTDIKSFDISSSLNARRMLAETHSQQHIVTVERSDVSSARRLATYTWQITFVVEASLAEAGVSSATALSTLITNTLEASTFQEAVADQVPGAVVDASSVLSMPVSPTTSPTLLPVPSPSATPTLQPSVGTPSSGGGGGGDGEALAASTTFIIIGACFFVFLACGGMYFYRQNHFEKFAEDAEHDDHFETTESESGWDDLDDDGVEMGVVSQGARPGLVKRRNSFTTTEKAGSETQLERMATNFDLDVETGDADPDEEEGPHHSGEEENLDMDESEHDQEEIIQQQQRQLEIREAILERRRLAALNDKKLTKANYIINSDIYTTAEKLEALFDLQLSDADYENCMQVVLRREEEDLDAPPRAPPPVRRAPSGPPPTGGNRNRPKPVSPRSRKPAPNKPVSPRARPSARTRNAIKVEEDIIGASSSESENGGYSDEDNNW